MSANAGHRPPLLSHLARESWTWHAMSYSSCVPVKARTAKKGALAKVGAPLLFELDNCRVDFVMSVINCPKCGEENPAEAVMCWACYTPLHGQSTAKEVVPKADAEHSSVQKVGHAITDNLPVIPLASLIASGWLSRRARGPVLGVSLLALGGFFIEQRWRERKEAREIGIDEEACESPIIRIAQTVFYYALREKAATIRLRENGRGVSVHYLIEGNWHEQMKIPLYVWRPLRYVLLDYARQGEVQSVTFDLVLSPRSYCAIVG